MDDPVLPSPAHGKRILIVDSDPLVRDQIVDVLTGFGFDLEESTDLLSAIATIVRRKPDLILTDLHLAVELDGLKLCQKLRSTPGLSSLPILFFTAERSRERIIAAIKAGASGVFLKQSYSTTLLLQKIESALGISVRAKSPAPAATAAGKPMPEKGWETKRREITAKPGARPTRDEVRRTLQEAAEVRTLPHVASEILRLSNEERSDAKTLRRILEGDPSVAARVLKMANSTYYQRLGKVDSLDRAIVNIGFRGIRQMVLSISLVDEFRGKGNVLDRARLWRHSVFTATLGRALAALVDREFAEEVFIGCLLHDLGKAVLDDLYPEIYQETILKAIETRKPLHVVEQDAFGIHHAGVAKIAASKWNFPSEIVDPMALHHSPPSEFAKSHSESYRHICLCQAANILAKCYGMGLGLTDFLEHVPTEIRPLKDMSPEKLHLTFKAAHEQFRELDRLLALGAHSSEGEDAKPDEGTALLIQRDRGSMFPVLAAVHGHGGRPVRDHRSWKDGWTGERPALCILGPAPAKALETDLTELSQQEFPESGPPPTLVLVDDALPEPQMQICQNRGLHVLTRPVTVQQVGEWLKRPEMAPPAPPTIAASPDEVTSKDAEHGPGEIPGSGPPGAPGHAAG